MAGPYSTPNAPPLLTPNPQTAPATPLPLLLGVMILAMLPMLVLSTVAAHWRVDVVDDQMFGYFGWRMNHGGTVYVDVWDNKPPGIYWTNALGFWLTGDHYAGVVVLCVLAVLAAHACFFAIAASVYFRGAAALATVLASFYMTHIYYQGGANRTETFLVAFELAAVLCYVRGCARDRNWLWLLSGFLCGIAFLYKQVGLAAWGSMGLHTILLVLTRDLSWKFGLRRCLLLLTGALGAVGAGALLLASEGALAEAYRAVVVFNRAYFDIGRSRWVDTWVNRHFLTQHLFPILTLPYLMAAAAAIHATLWRVRPLLRPREIEQPLTAFRPACPRYMPLFGIWFVVSFYGACVSPHYFRHYLVPTLPPLLLFGAYLLNVIKTELSLVRRLEQRGWVCAAFVAMAYFAYDAFVRQKEAASLVWWWRQPEYKDGRWRWQDSGQEALGKRVAALTPPGETLYAWGYFPGVYLAARRESTCRYFTNEKIGQIKTHPQVELIRREIQDELKTHPPACFIISANDYYWITGQGAPEAPDWLGKWMGTWLQEKYRVLEMMATEDDNIFVLQRADLAPPAATEPASQAAAATQEAAP